MLGRCLIQLINRQLLHQIRATHGKGLIAGTDDNILLQPVANGRLCAVLAEARTRQDDRNDGLYVSQDAINDKQ